MRARRISPWRSLLGAPLWLTATAIVACSSKSSPSTAASFDDSTSCMDPGGPTPGPADTHCIQDDGGLMIQSVSPAGCTETGDAGGGCAYAATMYGQDGDDDDCKYHVEWISTPLCEGDPGVVFTVVATYLGTSTPLTGAHTHIEYYTSAPGDGGGGYCDDMTTHPGPTGGGLYEMTETTPGTYVGRIEFDASGSWTIRFHFNENCMDIVADSPHGHAAFHVTVP
jgi:hypothetical protein